MAEGRALVPVQGADATSAHSPAGQRPAATFLAQLIAVAGHAPQTRERRRAEPREAASAYARTSSLANRAA